MQCPKINLKSAFISILVAEGSRKHTAFTVSGLGLYQFRKMPFDLFNALKTFSRLINMLFEPEFEPYVFGYLDDILVMCETFEKHLYWVERTLRILLNTGLKINTEKCEFECSSLTYSGYVLDFEGFRPDPQKVTPVLEMPSPKNVKELKRVLDCFGWYVWH